MTSLAVDAPLSFSRTAKRFTWLIIIVIVGIGLAAWLAAVGAARPPRALDPRDASPIGARALAELVRQRGVTVSVVTDPSQLQPASDTTVVVSEPSLLGPEASTLAASGADVVLMAPDQDTTNTFGIDVRSQVDVLDATPQPNCDLTAAQLAGGIAASGISYRAGAGATGCYPAEGGDLLLVGSRAGTTTVVLGAVEGLFNKNLARAGNAALGVNLLTTRPVVQWLAPPPIGSPSSTGHKGVLELLPARLLWAVAELGVAIVLLALWRGRRLGPVVAESLPVVVRATETVEGKARLLRAARARGQAARALRASALRRLSGVIHAGSTASPDAITTAAAARSGRDEVAVRSLLYGAEPASDEALVVMAEQLDQLEAEVRRQ